MRAANASARSLMSVAVDCAAWRDSRSAWIPFPVHDVERALDRLPDRRWASVAEGRWTPATRSAPSTSSRSDAIRSSSCGTTRTSPWRSRRARSASPVSTRSSPSSLAGTGSPSEQEREQHREAIGSGREPAPVDLEIRMREDRLAGRVQAPGDPGTGEPGSSELLPQPRRGCRAVGGDGRRLQILTFFEHVPAGVDGRIERAVGLLAALVVVRELDEVEREHVLRLALRGALASAERIRRDEDVVQLDLQILLLRDPPALRTVRSACLMCLPCAQWRKSCGEALLSAP